MKALQRLWKRISGQSDRVAELPVMEKLFQELAAAKGAHIQDLRLLLDQAHKREEELAGMVKLVMEERFYRPTVTGKATPQRTTPVIPAEALTDVAEFDSEADRQTIAGEVEQHAAVQREFQALMTEENEFRSGRGMTPVDNP